MQHEQQFETNIGGWRHLSWRKLVLDFTVPGWWLLYDWEELVGDGIWQVTKLGRKGRSEMFASLTLQQHTKIFHV